MGDTIEQLTLRGKELRKLSLRMANMVGSEGAHIGPAFSIMDIMNALFFNVMNHRVDDPEWEDRDRVILSKGHGCLGLYAPLVMAGYISEAEAFSFNKPHTRIAGHPSGKGVHGIEHPAGSLGHGLSIGCGIAKSAKIRGKAFDTYVVIGDGECDEGSVWETVMFAAQHGLDNLTAVVDVNGFQYGGSTKELMDLSPLEDKWRTFGWDVVTVNGHDYKELCDALDKNKRCVGKPKCVIAHTEKGHGASMFVGNAWHHGVVDKETMEKAIKELEGGTDK